jgi:5,10-methylenetetrahydrofolate reductase
MKIHEIIKNQGKSVSFEFFPPKDQTGKNKILSVIKRLEALGPDFVSVTYGAAGGTQRNTARLIERISRFFHFYTMNQAETVTYLLGSLSLSHSQPFKKGPGKVI